MNFFESLTAKLTWCEMGVYCDEFVMMYYFATLERIRFACVMGELRVRNGEREGELEFWCKMTISIQ